MSAGPLAVDAVGPLQAITFIWCCASDMGNARRILLAILALLGASALPGDAVSGDEYALEFIPTQNALPGVGAMMNIKVRHAGTTVGLRLQGGYPNTVYTVWIVFGLLKEPLPTTGSSVPAVPASTRAGFPPEGNGVSPLARLDDGFTAGMGLDPGASFVTDDNGDGEVRLKLDYNLITEAPVSSRDVVAQCTPGPPTPEGTCLSPSKRILVTTTWLRRFIGEFAQTERASMCANYDPRSDPESGMYDPILSSLDARFWQCIDPVTGLPRVHRFQFDHFRLAPHPDGLTHGLIGGNATDHFIDMVGRRADLQPKPARSRPDRSGAHSAGGDPPGVLLRYTDRTGR